MPSSELKKQVLKFGIFGVIALLTDMLTYFCMLHILEDVNLVPFSHDQVAKTISFIVGTTVTYILNKKYTWKQTDSSKSRFAKFLVLYGFSLVINVGINTLSLKILAELSAYFFIPFMHLVAFFCAASSSAVLTFIGQKFWVFKVK